MSGNREKPPNVAIIKKQKKVKPPSILYAPCPPLPRGQKLQTRSQSIVCASGLPAEQTAQAASADTQSLASKFVPLI